MTLRRSEAGVPEQYQREELRHAAYPENVRSPGRPEIIGAVEKGRF
jgi:hypothetical protein